jgi:hypothetical protein
LDRFAAFFSFGVRAAFFFSSLLFLISLGMVFAPNICVGCGHRRRPALFHVALRVACPRVHQDE